MNAELHRLIAVRAGAVDSTLGAAVDYVNERKRRYNARFPADPQPMSAIDLCVDGPACAAFCRAVDTLTLERIFGCLTAPREFREIEGQPAKSAKAWPPPAMLATLVDVKFLLGRGEDEIGKPAARAGCRALFVSRCTRGSG
jgi:hypothetical protein